MMSKTVIPHGYKPLLDLYQTQTAIGCLKRNFEQKLCAALNLKRVSAPLFVEPSTGLNDDLNGVERPVSFDLKETGRTAQVVHSLAKWKRMALYKYGFTAGEGLYTDMNAIRRDEEMDNLHSVYVDQWDWEKVITPAERTTAYLQSTVRAIYAAVSGTLDGADADEDAQLTHGDKHEVYDTEFGRVGMMVCYDIRFCELSRIYALKKADVLVVVSNFPNPRVNHWRTLLMARAIENQMFVVACNRVGPSPMGTYCGHSIIIDPWGEVIAEGGDEQEIVTGSIDFGKTKEVRDLIHMFRDRQPQLYGTTLTDPQI